MVEDQKALTELRKKIDTIDDQLLSLLNKRAQLALKVRIAKGSTNVYRPQREAEILERLKNRNDGPLSAEAVSTLFQSIIFICRSIQDIEIKDR